MTQPERKQKLRTMDMTVGDPLKLILQFAIPLFIGMLFQQAYNLIDTMIVGHGLGDNAVGSIGATAALYSVLINFAGGMNNGFAIIISRFFGAKDSDGLKKAAAAMVVLDAVITLVLTAVSLPLLNILLRWLDTPEGIFGMAYQYIFVILAGMIATVAYNMCAGFLRAVGNSRTPLYFLIFSCALNVVLDLLFIVVLRKGVTGAAVATVISQAVSAVLCLFFIFKKYSDFMPQKKHWKTDGRLMREMLTTGLSMGLMLSVFSIGSIILQKGINLLGTPIITAHTVSRRIFELLAMPLATLATANAAFVGQNFGAEKYGRIKKSMKTVMMLELLWSVFAVIIAYSLGKALVRMLISTNNESIINNVLIYLKVCTVFFFPLGILHALRNAMQAMGYKISPVLSSSIELAAKVVFCFWVIPRMGYMGVIITEPIIWVVCAVYLGAVYLITRRRQKI